MNLGAGLIGALTGILSGFGVGGGTLLVLYLTWFGGVDQHAAGGINLLYFLCCAPTALVGHIRHRQIEFQAVGWCVLGGLITSPAAALLATVIQTDWLHRGFGVLLIYVGLRELFSRSGKQENGGTSEDAPP